jgi:hypothetical protein
MVSSRWLLIIAGLCATAFTGIAAPPPPKNPAPRTEPAYKSDSPRYCRLVLGPEAKESVWLVIDGESLYVDRNGNGDLTEDGERITRSPPGPGGSGFEVPILFVGRKDEYTKLIVYWDRQPAAKTFTVEVMVEVGKRYVQYANFKAEALPPDAAPVIHFGGPLEMAFLGAAPQEGGKEVEVRAVIGTRSQTGHLAMVRHDRKLAPGADVHPAVEVTFNGAEPIRVPISLDQRCCNVQFYGAVKVPAGAKLEQIKVDLSFPGWVGVKVRPTAKDVRIVKP